MQIFLQEFYKIKNPFLLGKDFIEYLLFYFTYLCLDPGLLHGTCKATFISIASAA